MEEYLEAGFPKLVALLVAIIISLIAIRLTYVLLRCGKPFVVPPERVSTMIVLGSGGHTAEMLSIVNVLNKERFSPRFYVAAATDNMSLQKAQVLEQSLLHQGKGNAEAAQFMQIYRSREVGQSYITSIGTSLIAIAHAIWFILKIRPQVIICNGPGTCIPLCVAAFMFKVVGLRWSSIFYIESIARVRKLSLSGLLLYKLHLTDQFVVQWPQLQSKYPQSQYVGRIM
ncbi:beta-1,4-N-acetylglucosaminyltransferase protein [Dioscorea alata]|uniref:Beta-1,4-N-acetylglucosaminyltransferase protein n=2 Tax=Dioscorea alata TaxID=55571 RepID=A0ACB7UFY4_DIOAL|nr:beta-1,4-N-acetylglucosaminyltransferase protein [Dioscorea alata]